METTFSQRDGKPRTQYDSMNRRYGVKCYNCQEFGHRKFECTQSPLDPKCFQCGKQGHKKAECTDLTNRKITREFKCFKCGEVGHRKFECQQGENRNTTTHSTMGRVEFKCFKCGEVGHRKSECLNDEYGTNC